MTIWTFDQKMKKNAVHLSKYDLKESTWTVTKIEIREEANGCLSSVICYLLNRLIIVLTRSRPMSALSRHCIYNYTPKKKTFEETPCFQRNKIAFKILSNISKKQTFSMMSLNKSTRKIPVLLGINDSIVTRPFPAKNFPEKIEWCSDFHTFPSWY